MNGPELTFHHPLSPLDPHEISKCAHLISAALPKNAELQFKTIILAEPPKRILVSYLEKEHKGLPRQVIDRKAFATYYIRNTVSWLSRVFRLNLTSQDRFHEAIVNLTSGQLERNVRLGPHIHGNLDAEEVLLVERIVLEDESVKAEIAKLKLPPGTVVCADPWPYGRSRVHPWLSLIAIDMIKVLTASTTRHECTRCSCTCVTLQTPMSLIRITMRSLYLSLQLWTVCVIRSFASTLCQLAATLLPHRSLLISLCLPMSTSQIIKMD